MTAFQDSRRLKDDSAVEPTRATSTLTSEAEWREAAGVLRTLLPSLDTENFVGRREQLLREGYVLLGLRVGTEIVAIASYTVSPHAVLGRELLVHDMATLAEHQRQGHAAALLADLSAIAKREGCGRIFAQTRNAQGLYLRCGFEQYSAGMMKKVD